MFKMRTKIAFATTLCALVNLQVLSSCALENRYSALKSDEPKATELPFNKHPSMLKSGASVNDVLSKRVVCESYFDGKDTIQVILLGDRVVHEYQDGAASDIAYFESNGSNPIQSGFGTGNWVLTNFFTDFKKQKQLEGQANLSIRINSNQTCEVVTKTIYVPGREPYIGGDPTDPKVEEFWQQVRSAVAAIESDHLRLPSPMHKSMTLELVVGRDRTMFPRYPTPFDGQMVRDSSGTMRHTKAFVRDGAE